MVSGINRPKKLQASGQMHFSFASDKVLAEARAEEKK